MVHVNKRSGPESKKRILKAALKVFSERGYKGASMRAIASTAGISVGALYLYFSNKEDLYSTLIKDKLDVLADRTGEILRDAQDPAEALKDFIAMRLEYAKKHREYILVQAREHGFTFGIKMKKDFFRHQREGVEEIIRRGIASGQFRKCNAGEVAKIVICSLRGFILSIVVEPDALFSAEECGNLILKGLLAKGRE